MAEWSGPVSAKDVRISDTPAILSVVRLWDVFDASDQTKYKAAHAMYTAPMAEGYTTERNNQEAGTRMKSQDFLEVRVSCVKIIGIVR